MAWLRLYDDLLDNPKVQKLDPELFKAYINILCVARKEDAGGVLPSDEDLAFYLREELSRVTSRVTALIGAKLIDEKDGVRELHDWKSLQFESDKDPTAKERKRRQREKKSEENGAESELPLDGSAEDVTRDVTDVSRSPEQNRTDTESEQKEPAPQASPKPPPAKKLFIPPKGVGKASKLPAKSEWAGTTLRKALEDSFDSQNLGADGKPRYGNYQKEQTCLNSICSMVRNLAGPGNEETVANGILTEFLRLTQSTDKFWNSRPFSPSGLSPVFDQVAALARKRAGTGPPGGDLVAEYERQQAAKKEAGNAG